MYTLNNFCHSVQNLWHLASYSTPQKSLNILHILFSIKTMITPQKTLHAHIAHIVPYEHIEHIADSVHNVRTH